MKHASGISILTACLLSLTGTGCNITGGGSPKGDPEGVVTISGTVLAGTVAGAQVTAQRDGAVLAGPVAATAAGEYTLRIPAAALADDFTLQATGGAFTDAATGNSEVPFGALSAYVAAGSLDTGAAIHLTPAGALHAALRAVGNEGAEADSLLRRAFGFAPSLAVRPTNAASPQSSSPEEERLAGLRAAAFSQLTQDLGLAPARQFELLQALARDLTDGRLDGRDASGALDLSSGGTLPEDIQNRFERSLLKFLAARKDNLALTADKIGTLPFGKVAFTDDYRVEYLEGMMPAQPGRTQFKIKVSDRATGNPVAGLTLQLIPLMHMASHQHSTPVGRVTDNGDGTYNCEVYYLMASAMGAASMGYWELKVATGPADSSVRLYPLVGMSMGGNTARATLRGVADKISNMGMAATRTYHVFNDGLTGSAGNHAFAMYLATTESMMSYPPVFPGASLKNEQGNAWTVDSMAVSVSTDGTTWISATSQGGGKWVANGLAGLAKDVAGTIRVRVVVNGEQKTTDGLAPAADPANGHASFSVTPRN